MTPDACYELLVARDRRADGVFFVGVRTTGIYCRPICPARTPQKSRCAFFATCVEAEAAGFRACFRCRPELAPGNASTDSIDAVVSTATQRIAEGALNEGTIDDLAAELGITARHLRRATQARLGVTPIELAQSKRLALAKHLLQDTAAPITAIAFAAGFRSVRRFNALFAAKMGGAPSALRRTEKLQSAGPVLHGGPISLRLDYRPPYDWERMLAFLGGRAIPGVELVADGEYRRVVSIGDCSGEIAVRPARGQSALQLDLAPALLPVVMSLVARVRRMFDVDARPDVIARVLSRSSSFTIRPGLRLPGAIDPFEAAVRAMLGQQVSVAAATTLAGRFAAQLGSSVAEPGRLAYTFPTPTMVVNVGVERIVKVGVPMTRATAIHTLAQAVATRRVRLDVARDLESFVDELVGLPGIGPWTAHYIAMRALHMPDAFPSSDLGIQKALGTRSAKSAEAIAEAWRPYRSYAVMHLWTSLGESR